MKIYNHFFESMFLACFLSISSVGLTQIPNTVVKGESENDLKQRLIQLEKSSWEAWKNHDGKFFQEFLSEDHVEVGFSGIADKAAVVATVNSSACNVKNYTIDKFKVSFFDTNTALVTYYADQETTCNGKAVQRPVWASSFYQKRNGHWLNISYQQTQTN